MTADNKIGLNITPFHAVKNFGGGGVRKRSAVAAMSAESGGFR